MADNEQSIGTARVDVVVDTSTAGASVDGLKSKASQLGPAFEAAYDRANTAQKRVIDSLLKQADAIGKTRQQLIQMKADAAGIPTAAMDVLKAKLDATATAATGAGHAVEEFTLNNSNARRELGRLASDLVNGNFGRFQQTALTLANYSGILGKVFTGTGLLITGLTAAVAGFAVAAYEGSQETTAYNKALILTGNYAGVTAGQLADMARQSANGISTQGDFATALTAVAASGKFTADQIRLVGTAAVNMGQLTGQSVDQTIQQFEQLKQAPLEAVLKLNDSQHFLTLSVYDQIKALQDQGNAQGAATLAMTTYADTIAQRKNDAVQNLGLIEQAWRGLVGAAKAAGDAALSIGRQQTGQQQFNQLSGQLDQLNAEKASGAQFDLNGGQDIDTAIASTRAKMAALQNAYVATQKQLSAQALQDQIVQDKADSDAEVKEFATNAQKRATDIIKVQGEYNDRIARAVQSGNTTLASQLKASEALVVAGINQKYKDPKTPRPKADPFNNLNGLVQKAAVFDNNVGAPKGQSEQVTQILAIVDAGAKLITSGKDVTKVQADVAKGVAYLNDGYTKQAAILQQQNQAALGAYVAAMDKADAALKAQYADRAAAIGLGTQEAQEQEALNRVYQDQANRLEQIAAKQQEYVDTQGKSGYSQTTADKYTAAVQADTTKRVNIIQNGYVQMDAAQADWTNGAIAAMQDYADQGANVANQTKSLFTDAFNDMNTSLLAFATTGKLSFKGLMTSILTDLAKMELRVAESSILKSILGVIAPSIGSGSVTDLGGLSSSWTSDLASVGGGSFSIAPNAKGGVYDSPSLAAYSSQIVSKPTMFKFAKGAALGVAGEVPGASEAIMPLKRDSQGRLGVIAGGTSSGSSINFVQNISVDNSGNATETTSGGLSQGDAARAFASRMAAVAKQQIATEMRNGGLLARAGVKAA